MISTPEGLSEILEVYIVRKKKRAIEAYLGKLLQRYLGLHADQIENLSSKALEKEQSRLMQEQNQLMSEKNLLEQQLSTELDQKLKSEMTKKLNTLVGKIADNKTNYNHVIAVAKSQKTTLDSLRRTAHLPV